MFIVTLVLLVFLRFSWCCEPSVLCKMCLTDNKCTFAVLNSTTVCLPKLHKVSGLIYKTSKLSGCGAAEKIFSIHFASSTPTKSPDLNGKIVSKWNATERSGSSLQSRENFNDNNLLQTEKPGLLNVIPFLHAREGTHNGRISMPASDTIDNHSKNISSIKQHSSKETLSEIGAESYEAAEDFKNVLVQPVYIQEREKKYLTMKNNMKNGTQSTLVSAEQERLHKSADSSKDIKKIINTNISLGQTKENSMMNGRLPPASAETAQKQNASKEEKNEKGKTRTVDSSVRNARVNPAYAAASIPKAKDYSIGKKLGSKYNTYPVSATVIILDDQNSSIGHMQSASIMNVTNHLVEKEDKKTLSIEHMPSTSIPVNVTTYPLEKEDGKDLSVGHIESTNFPMNATTHPLQNASRFSENALLNSKSAPTEDSIPTVVLHETQGDKVLVGNTTLFVAVAVLCVLGIMLIFGLYLKKFQGLSIHSPESIEMNVIDRTSNAMDIDTPNNCDQIL